MCKHRWEENWKGELYCEKCGIFKADLKTKYRQPAPTPKPDPCPVKSQQQIYDEIDNHPLYGFARRLALQIIADYGFDGKVIFRNMRGADCRQKRNGSFLIRFGYQGIDYDAKHGFQDLKTLHWMLWEEPWTKLTGKKSVWALVLHECAHMTHGWDGHGNRPYGVQHPQSWVEEVRNLRELYPFETVV